MKEPCGCCAGVEVVTPGPEANRPGLPALSYRAGTHESFMETMLARLTSSYLDIPAAEQSDHARAWRSFHRPARRLGHGGRRAYVLPGAHRQRRLSADGN